MKWLLIPFGILTGLLAWWVWVIRNGIFPGPPDRISPPYNGDDPDTLYNEVPYE
jgi:hypothetical protein